MVKLQRISSVLLCAGLLTLSSGCASTRTHESAGEYVDNTVITTKVKAAIFSEASLKTLQINVKSYKDEVQLSGFVDSAESAAKAGKVARSVQGVGSVKNDLLVK